MPAAQSSPVAFLTTLSQFVQCMANPWYLNHLAAQKYLDSPDFVAYLGYLQYFAQPQYAKYLTYVILSSRPLP